MKGETITFNEWEKADLKRAAERYSARAPQDEIGAKTIGELTALFVGLISAHWDGIKEAALEDEAGGKVSVALKIDLNMALTLPVGDVGIAYVAKKVKDSASFQVEDPGQGDLFKHTATFEMGAAGDNHQGGDQAGEPAAEVETAAEPTPVPEAQGPIVDAGTPEELAAAQPKAEPQGDLSGLAKAMEEIKTARRKKAKRKLRK